MAHTRFMPGQWYHCFNRGVEKRRLFLDREDYERFQMLLYTSNSTKLLRVSDIHASKPPPIAAHLFSKEREETIVDIGAYVMMPNHYHLLLHEKRPGGISTFMRKLGTAYSMYFNIKYGRSGCLFESSFKTRDATKHLHRVVNYIHGNPSDIYEPGVSYGVIRDLSQLRHALVHYAFSSLWDYGGDALRNEATILSSEVLEDALQDIPSLTGVLEDFKSFYATSNKRLWT